jgi:hypothetical protein
VVGVGEVLADTRRFNNGVREDNIILSPKPLTEFNSHSQ